MELPKFEGIDIELTRDAQDGYCFRLLPLKSQMLGHMAAVFEFSKDKDG